MWAGGLQFQQLFFGRTVPKVTLLDMKSSASDLTTYTFSSCNLGAPGGTATAAGELVTALPHIQSSSRSAIIVCIHSEDAATNFGITSCSLGGVAGVEAVDRLGATVLGNSGIYVFDTAAIAGITNTDIVVVMTEAVTACAIGVILVDGLGVLHVIATASGTGINTFVSPVPAAVEHQQLGVVMIIAATSENPATLPQFTPTSSTSTGGGLYAPILLYEGATAEHAFAAAYAVGRFAGGTAGTHYGVGVNTGSDFVAIVLAG